MSISRRQGLTLIAALANLGPRSSQAAGALADSATRAVLNGVDHWYRVAGAAHRTRPLVIVHGGPGGSAYVFERLQGFWLERKRTVVYYDQRGGGRSAAPTDSKDYAMASLVADLDALVRRLGAPRVDLLGFSFGAELALEYALSHPERLGRLVLQSPSGGDYVRMAETETYGFAALARNGDDRKRLERLAREPIVSPAARIATIWAGAEAAIADRFQYHRATAAAEARRLDAASGFQNTGLMNAVMFSDDRMGDKPLMQRAAGFAVPTLVLVGAYDRTTGVDVARDLAVTLADARLVVFAESGHFPCYEEPELYAQFVTTFLGAGSR